MLLSLNRFVQLKNLGLAIHALAALRERLPPAVYTRQSLVVAGSCDQAGLQYLGELKDVARRLGVADRVEFKPSCSEAERLRLLSACRCLVYTPDEEHFGYGPVEAMAAARPVVAVNSGGPLETVIHGETGLLAPPTPAAFADAIAGLLLDPARADRMGRAGRARVAQRFSFAAFESRLRAIVDDLMPHDARERAEQAAVNE
jgi:alpha-1,3/alpha-1,6-mannosyltransferase